MLGLKDYSYPKVSILHRTKEELKSADMQISWGIQKSFSQALGLVQTIKSVVKEHLRWPGLLQWEVQHNRKHSGTESGELHLFIPLA